VRAPSPMRARSVPATAIRPWSIVSNPARQFSSVVLPQPLDPMIATISPWRTANDTSASAVTVAPCVRYVLAMRSAATIIGGAAGRDDALSVERLKISM
jgi:hypothetical protein